MLKGAFKIPFSLFLAVAVLAGLAAAQSRTQLTLSGGAAYTLSYGNESDYAFGINDFPVTPANYAGHFGVTLTQFIGRTFGLSIEAREILRSKMTLEDPSDKDTVDTKTSRVLALSAGIVLRFGRGGLRPYLAAGGGVERLLDTGTQTLTSKNGYEVILEAPEKTQRIAAYGGAGLELDLAKWLGARLEARYVYVRSETDMPAIHRILISAGLVFQL